MKGMPYTEYISMKVAQGYKRVKAQGAIPTPSHMSLYQMMQYKLSEYSYMPPE